MESTTTLERYSDVGGVRAVSSPAMKVVVVAAADNDDDNKSLAPTTTTTTCRAETVCDDRQPYEGYIMAVDTERNDMRDAKEGTWTATTNSNPLMLVVANLLPLLRRCVL